MIIIRSMMKTKMKMRNIKTVIFLLTVFGANCLDALEENARTASTASTFSTSLAPTLGVTNSSIQLIDKKIDIALTKAEHKNTEEPGFISKISNLIFGGADDSTPAETHPVVHYGPPPGPSYGNGGNNGHHGHGRPQNQADCNPCNKEPWIPIMRSHAHQHQQHHHQTYYQGPQQNLQYGPPQIQPPIHNAQPFLQNNFGHSGPEIGIQHLPLENYGPPTFNNYQGPQHVEDNYGAHDFTGPLHPPNNYGPPVPPPKDYAVPPALQHPILQSPDYGTSLATFGPPKPLKEFNPPPIAELHSPPLPSLSSHFGNHYGPPKPIYKIPNKNHGPSINQPDFNNHHKPIHNPGKSPRQIRPGFGRPGPNQHHYGPPSPQPVYKYIPIHKGKMQNLPTNFEPPPPPPHYNSGGPIFNSYQKPIHQNIQAPQNHIQRPLSDIKTHITNPEYLPPPQQLPIASGHNAEPLPLPNLSLTPIAPLHNPQNFHDNFPQPGSKIEIPYESNVQIQQSIPLVDYLATIEHPINIIRSPILDVNVANSTTQSDGYYVQSSPPVQSPAPIQSPPPSLPQGPHGTIHQQEQPKLVQSSNNFEPTYRPSEYANYDDYKLSENPIVVEDTYTAAATNANKTVSNYNNLQSSSELNAGFINQILSNINGIHDDEIQVPQGGNSQQTSSPSTSMQPPPIGESPWLASINAGRLVDSTTKKPKQIQIIIPYTTNNNNPANNQRQQNRLSPNEQKIQNTHNTHQHSNNQKPIPIKQEMIQESASQEAPTGTKQPTNVINIKEFFKQNPVASNFNNLPFDVIRLQKNIDGWTEQEYSKNIVPENTKPSLSFTAATSSLASSHVTTAITKFVTSKRIPDEYLTTLPYYSTEIKSKSSVTTPIPSTPSNHAQSYQDHEPAGSNSKEYLDSNLVATTEPSTTPKYNKLQTWDKIHIAVSPYTKEKIYVVTPQPKSAASTTSGWRQSRDNNKNENSNPNNSSSTFSISIMPMKNETNEPKDVRVVLSEWPHLINNLATTLHTQPSSTTTLPPPTTRNSSPHPLFGLMDLSSYTPPANSTIETYSGHSKVINVATASLRKHSAADENKTTPRSTTTTTLK